MMEESPFELVLPSLDRTLVLQYPSDGDFDRLLHEMQERIRRLVTRAYSVELGKLVQAGAYHGLSAVMANHFGQMYDTIENYVGGFALTTRMRQPAVGRFFEEAARGIFPKLIAREVDQTQLELTPRPRSFDDPLELKEHIAWVFVVRMCILSRVLGALDYARVWAEVDGDAGWWLSEKLDRLAHFVRQHRSYRLLSGRPGLGRMLGHEGLCNLVVVGLQSIEGLPAKVLKWREAYKQADVSDLGTRVPWTFSPLDAKLFDWKSASPFPPEMYARRKTIDRAWRVRESWAQLRYDLVAMGELTLADSRDFLPAVNAANLEHGGRHPPHTDHKDGSMLDLDLQNLPHLVYEPEVPPTEDTAIEQRPEPESVADSPADEDAAEPSAAEEKDWVFATGGKTTRRRIGEFYRASEGFTRCIYLTFPSSVILASESVLATAHWNLGARIEELIGEATDAKDNPKAALLRLALGLVGDINISPWKGKSSEKQFQIRFQHRHHWHVNYNPHLLGREESKGGSIPTQRAPSAEVRDYALSHLEPSLRDSMLKDPKDLHVPGTSPQ